MQGMEGNKEVRLELSIEGAGVSRGEKARKVIPGRRLSVCKGTSETARGAWSSAWGTRMHRGRREGERSEAGERVGPAHEVTLGAS